MTVRMNLLIYEPLGGGHRPDYIGCLVDFLRRHPPTGRIRFALPADFFRDDPRREALLRDLAPNVDRVAVPPDPGSPHALLQTIRDFKPDCLLLLELTRWENFLCRRRLPCDVAGILFVQYPEIDWRAGRGMDRWVRLARRWAKDFKTSLWLRRQSVRAVFLLHGERAAEFLNRRFPAHPVFHAIPDPAPIGVSNAGVGAPGDRMPAGKPIIRFLLPGALSKRKGCFRLIEALHRIASETTRKAEFRFLGEAEAGDRSPLEHALLRLRERRPDVRVTFDNRTVSKDAFQSAIAEADWILMPYLRPEYSSGILGRAVAAGTPVIGPSDGLLGRLIQTGKLGRTTGLSPDALSRSLDTAANDSVYLDPEARRAFLDRCRPDDFAAVLLALR